jgi:galactokinase
LLVDSTVPEGAGVSSSAALGVALVRGLCAAFSIPAPPAQTVARLARRIENDFIGLQCGIMDHMVSATGKARSAMHLDCRDLSYNLHSLPAGHVFLVIHSGSGRKLSEGIYNERVAECRAAAAAMGVASLRDADTAQIADIDDRLVRRRAQHVLSENDRVNAAAQALVSGDVGTLGTLITASHKSLATDYEVSAAPLDILVKATLSAGALGSRLTGAGFGGCIVCLAPADLADDIVAAAQQGVPGSWLLDSIAS